MHNNANRVTRGLTKYPSASLRELIYISTSLILVLFSGSFMGFCDRLFLSYHSLVSLEACVSASSLIALFQIPSISIASITQVFVARYKGMGKAQDIGKSVWQMIWWSLLSFIFIAPLGLLVEPFYFQNASIAPIGKIYFRTLLLFNFLFPLGASLSSFYIGQGKIKSNLLITLVSHLINIVSAPILIFGIKGIVPSLGILGAGIASVVAQLAYCTIFFARFLKRKNQERYGSLKYAFEKQTFFKQIKVGIPSALSRMITLFTWVGASQILLKKGGDYLLIFSFGSSLSLLFSFLNEGIGQGIVPIASHLMGQNKGRKIGKLMRSSYLLLAIFLAFLLIPCMVFSEATIDLPEKNGQKFASLQKLEIEFLEVKKWHKHLTKNLEIKLFKWL